MTANKQNSVKKFQKDPGKHFKTFSCMLPDSESSGCRISLEWHSPQLIGFHNQYVSLHKDSRQSSKCLYKTLSRCFQIEQMLELANLRSSHLEMFCGKDVLKYFAIFADIQTRNFIKKRLQHRFFPVNIVKFLRPPILKNICERLLLKSVEMERAWYQYGYY